MKFEKIINLEKSSFVLCKHQNRYYLLKNSNKIEKKIYETLKYYHFICNFKIMYSFLFIEYKSKFHNLKTILLSGNEFSLNNKIIIINTLIEYLKIIHNHNIALIDMKPQNILINNMTNEIIFIDFDHSYIKTKSGRIFKNIGRTFPFVPPEYKSKKYQSLEFLQKSDLFVLGMIILMIIGYEHLLLIKNKYTKFNYNNFMKQLPIFQKIINEFLSIHLKIPSNLLDPNPCLRFI
jgi:serine/threonine protein kinase